MSVLVAGVVVAALRIHDANPTDTGWSSLADIVYVLPEELPDGWTLQLATERAGRPRSEWEDHVEVLSTEAGDGYLLLFARRQKDADRPGATDLGSRPGAIVDIDLADLGYLLAYTVGAIPDGLTARSTSWHATGLDLAVTHIAGSPDDQVINEVADDFADTTDLDFKIPGSARDGGFAPVGNSNGFPADVTDYTISWTPRELAGVDRAAASAAPDEGPKLYLNVGCRFYSQAWNDAPTDPAAAAITQDGDTLQLAFVMDGSGISINGRGVTADIVRRTAISLHRHSHSAWQAQLGDRLHIDEPDT